MMDPKPFFAVAARLSAKGIAARPPEEGETLEAYLALLAGWVMDAAEQVKPEQAPVKTGPFIHPRADDHLIDHDALALLRGEQLDPAKRGVAFTYRRGEF